MGKVSHKNNKRHRTTRKIKAKPRLAEFKKGFGDGNVGRLWDKTKSPKINFARLGCAADVNADVDMQRVRGARLDNTISGDAFLAMVDGELPCDIPDETNPSRAAFFMKPEEVSYLQGLVARYGGDFGAMARDVKLNNQQWSAEKLATRCARLRSFQAAAAGAGGPAAAAPEAAGGAKGKKAAKAAAARASAAAAPADDFDLEARRVLKKTK